ncbi:Clavaminate synthase-like protein [Vararia minispora EC-137]|uniref:Clavaminate synthase-like protein n=1 Tax=Vararia minispora EC-137 TaxID=1314806 RepID=A0ACB8QY53_9AGAM|nr:Clavaminate synthase-like protein [Vararia minispora EC-137]
MPDTGPPPFPDDIPTVPLAVIDYGLIQRRDSFEIDRLWDAATQLGFWYLKNHGCENEADGMFAVGAETMGLPLNEKMNFTQGTTGNTFGYRSSGSTAVDASGTPGPMEGIGVSKDDALAWPRVVRRTYPSTVDARMESSIIPFVRRSVEINNTLINVFNDKLGLPTGTLAQKHAAHMLSGSEARCLRAPPNQNLSDIKISLGAHTDYGSLSILHHRVIGGLQVLLPGSEEWRYVKPIPRHAICNIGDALCIFSAGILRSGMHRVIPPPQNQAAYERWSVIFFTRPGDDVLLEALSSHSAIILEAVEKEKPGKFDTGSTAGEWLARRVKYRFVSERKGPETWLAAGGTEHATI